MGLEFGDLDEAVSVAIQVLNQVVHLVALQACHSEKEVLQAPQIHFSVSTFFLGHVSAFKFRAQGDCLQKHACFYLSESLHGFISPRCDRFSYVDS